MNSSLNHVYRVVWNASLGLWQVASEVARSGGKTQSEQRKTRRLKMGAAAVAGAFAGLASIAIPSVAFAQLPTGGQVVGGQASIVQSGNALNINQTTDRAAIDWQSFNVGQGNTVNFNQPSASSIALNRVLGNDVSVIQGSINANGQVFLVNQNGILFTPTAQVNVGGIVASTQSISTADFMAGKYTFSGNSTGTVENQGNITTSNGGTVALIAAKIINTGTITAPQGTVGLAAGNTVTLDLGGPVKIQVTQGALNTTIEQGGGIVADGGQIYLTAEAAGNLAASAINHTGISRARTLAGNQKGEIILIADMEVGTTTVAGTLDASAPKGGDGGFIETSAANVKIQDGVNITTRSAQGNDGVWLIDPIDFTIAATDGDITGKLLGDILNVTPLIIQTDAQQPCIVANTCGSGKEGNGDIFVNDDVTWSSPGKLTLRAHRNIVINKTITASGATGSLALEYGQGSMSGNGADYFIAADAKVNLQAGQNFSTKQGNGSSTRVFTVITALGAQGSTTGIDLQGISGNQAGNYALGADIDASATSGWESGQGFAPIFSFTGRFDGLGHKISNLTINRPNTSNGVGLFRNLSAGAVVQHLGLTNVSIAGSGTTGGIVGFSFNGLIRRSYTTGSISCVNGIQCGGILGLQQGATLQSVYSSASVSSSDTAGGLVGQLEGGSISDSYATGNISTVGGATGGLVGFMQGGTVTRSFATGTAKSTNDATADGGLVGLYLGGTITASFWDTQTSMTNNGVGTAGSSTTGVTGRSTADMQKIATYQAAGWNITGRDGTYPMLTFSSDSVWKIGPTTSPVFIRLDCGLCESIYGETPQFSFKAFTAASGGTAVTDAMLTGTALYSLTNGGVAAGTELGRLTDAG
ncbi:MAG TPA: filamentous hemagglutinin N-terminal domain-containing protein, partial [Cellvibrio sp.]